MGYLTVKALRRELETLPDDANVDIFVESIYFVHEGRVLRRIEPGWYGEEDDDDTDPTGSLDPRRVCQPCPKCGSDLVAISKKKLQDGIFGWWTECNAKCGLKSDACPDRETAIKWWNERPNEKR